MKILALKHKSSSVFRYRMERPLSNFDVTFRNCLLRKNDEATIETLAKRFLRYGKVWVIKYIDDFDTLNTLYSMRNLGAKIVIDIDDNMWQIPVGNLMRGTEKQNAQRGFMLAESVKSADWVSVSTEPLKTALTPLNANIAVLPNYIDEKEWKHKRKTHKKTRIGWVWSRTHIPDMEEAREALGEIAKRDDVEIVIFGASQNIFDFPTTNIPAVHVDKYPETLCKEGIDISIAPLLDNDFNRSKSDIKWQESTMAGAAFVGSKLYPYEMSVKHGKTGYLAKGKNQWIKHINFLIDSPEKRKELVENAREVVLENAKKNKSKWIEFYQCL